MNLHHLRFIRAVADSGSFSRAAQACHIGQPSLSTAVAQLEQQLGGRLFERTTRQVSLTPLGAHLLPLISGVLDAERDLRQAAEQWQRPARRLIRIGFSPAAQLQPVHLALAAYQREHPDSEVVFKECLREDLDRRLAEGSIDLALGVWLEGQKRESMVLLEEPLMLVPRQGAAGKQGRSGAIRSLAGETFVFTRGCGLADAVRDLFRRARVSIGEYPGQALSYRVIEEWADLGLGAGILPRSKLTNQVGPAIPLQLADGRPALIRTYASWRPGRDESAPERKFLTWLRPRAAVIARGVGPAEARRGRGAPARPASESLRPLPHHGK